MLVAPPQADAALTVAAAEMVAAFAAEHQLQFEQRQLLDPAQLPAGLEKLILLAPDPGTAVLAAAAPQLPIITVGFAPDGQFANVTTIGLSGDQDAQAAFIAGYVAALTADDWRAGMLYTAVSAPLADDFLAGAEFFCGACNPVAPPQAEYPQAVQVADAASWQVAADQLLASQIRVVYLPPELEASGAGQYLASFGVLLIGSGTPPEHLAASWLVSIGANPEAFLREQLPLALNGQPFETFYPLVLTHVNLSYLGEGRLSYVQTTMDDLMAGFILLPASD